MWRLPTGQVEMGFNIWENYQYAGISDNNNINNILNQIWMGDQILPFRWLKFTLKAPYTIAIGNFLLVI